MLDLLGTIGGNVLSFPGILGLALGMTTRNFFLAAALGCLIGVFEVFVFAGLTFAGIEPFEFIIPVLVGLCAGMLGCAIRIKGVAA